MHPSRPTHTTRTARRLRRIAAVGSVILVASTLAACSGGGNAAQNDNSSGSSGGGKGITIAVMGGATSDPFWSTVKNGGQAAEKAVNAEGGKVTFVAMPNYNNFNSDASKLVSNILALKPSAAVIPDWAPDAQNANIKALVQAGIPVIIYNTGEEEVKTVGAISYVGSDNTASGKLAGEELAKAGSQHVVCINTLPGQQTGQQYCDGLKEGASGAGIKESELDLPSSQFGDPTAVAQAIKGALVKDPSIDGVFTVSAGDATSAANAISQANLTGKVRIASQNFDADGLTRIKNGQETVAIDQQGYAQGYYAVSAAFQYAAYGISLGNIATGPTAITKANVDVVQKGQKLGVR